jgi:hypothetical protein
MAMDVGIWWVQFIATVFVAFAALHGTRSIAQRFLVSSPERGRFAASATVGVLLGVLLTFAPRLPFIVSFPLVAAAIGFYVGLLLIGTGWRHHLGTRVVYWAAVLVAVNVPRLIS